jgi:hypothetical protein
MENKTNYQEPEEFNDVIDAEWNPLDEPVNDKAYASAGISVTEDEMKKPIEEPRFAPPPSRKPTPQGAESKDSKAGGSAAPKKEPFNKEFSNLSKKETDMSAEHSAKMALKGYEWLHTMANKYIQISEKKLTRLQADGEINLNAMIQYDYGKEMRAGDFFMQYNQQVSQIFVVSEEFKEEFVPLLTKVLAKRGIGMTDEQRLAFLVGQDIATKAVLGFQIKKGQKDMIESIKQNTAAMVNLQKEFEAVNAQKQKQEQEQQEKQQQKESNKEKSNLVVTKRGRPTGSGSYRDKK